jgi:hypothetical protein
LGFKFGTFIEVDSDTNQMLRGDLARIKITTEKLLLIDSSVTVSVLGKHFEIYVVEEGAARVVSDRICCDGCKGWRGEGTNKQSIDGDTVLPVAVGFFEEGSDGDWSENGQLLLEVGEQVGRNRNDGSMRAEGEQEYGVSERNPNFLGNSLVSTPSKVNIDMVDSCESIVDVNRAIVLVPEETSGLKEIVPAVVVDTRSRVAVEGMGLVDGSVDIGPKQLCGPTSKPCMLRTRERDIPLGVIRGGVFITNGGEVESQQMDLLPVGPVDSCPVQVASRGSLKVPTTKTAISECGKGVRNKKTIHRAHPYLPCNNFLKIQELAQKKGGAMLRRKINKRKSQKNGGESSTESDPIQSLGVENQACHRQHICDLEGIGLEVVLSQNVSIEEDSICSQVPCSPINRGGAYAFGLEEVVREDLPVRTILPFMRGGMVDRNRAEAHHIIDIQEDLGIKFKGVGEEDVDRIMNCEVRDRIEKEDWEQQQGYQ